MLLCCIESVDRCGMEIDIQDVMDGMDPYLASIDGILRCGVDFYHNEYPPHVAIDHDASTQAHCTFRHILAEAHRVLDDIPQVRHLLIRGQNLWLIEPANAVIRFKKTDDDGVSSNYPTPQAMSFDCGEELPGLPKAPTRLTAGYLLDETGTGFVRSQISLPTRNGAMWCAAIIPEPLRQEGEASWYEVTRQRRII